MKHKKFKKKDRVVVFVGKEFKKGEAVAVHYRGFYFIGKYLGVDKDYTTCPHKVAFPIVSVTMDRLVQDYIMCNDRELRKVKKLSVED